jgi:hypothetical protein
MKQNTRLQWRVLLSGPTASPGHYTFSASIGTFVLSR